MSRCCAFEFLWCYFIIHRWGSGGGLPWVYNESTMLVEKIKKRDGRVMEFDRAGELIEEGEAAVERALPDIKAAFAVLCTHYTDESIQ